VRTLELTRGGHGAREAAGEDRSTLVLIVLAAMVPFAVILPYRDVHIPVPILWSAAAVLLLVCLKFAVEDYRKLLVLFAVYAPFQKELPGDFGGLMTALNFTNILLILLVVGWFSQSCLHGRRLVRRTPLDVPILLFVLLSSFSLVYGRIQTGDVRMGKVVMDLKRWLVPYLTTLVAADNVRNERDVKYLLVAVSLTVVLVAILGIKQYYMDLAGGRTSRWIRIDVVSAVNNLGAYFCYYSFYIAAYFLVKFKTLQGAAAIVPTFWCYWAMHLTASRGAKLAFLCASAWTALVRSRKLFYFIAAPVILWMVLAPEYVPPQIWGRLGKTVDSSKLDSHDFWGSLPKALDKSSAQRLVIWGAGLRMIAENPLTGAGFGNFRRRIKQYIAYEQAGRRPLQPRYCCSWNRQSHHRCGNGPAGTCGFSCSSHYDALCRNLSLPTGRQQGHLYSLAGLSRRLGGACGVQHVRLTARLQRNRPAVLDNDRSTIRNSPGAGARNTFRTKADPSRRAAGTRGPYTQAVSQNHRNECGIAVRVA